jgi:transposase
MIFPSNRVRIMVATKPVDFRKGHDGLAALVKNELHKDRKRSFPCTLPRVD